MDLNEDGKIDILSGSYSRKDANMAGLFQVLWGLGKGKFKKAEVLKGTDGEPLIIEASKEKVTDKICTRPTAVDLDDDGKLDIVSGNFTGTYAVFTGLGKGQFEPKNTWLMSGDTRFATDAHSDPFFVDWDGDGDFDMLCGGAKGGAFLCTNVGTKKQAQFAKPQKLVAAVGYSTRGTQYGDAHVTGPQRATRVFADDLDGDGKLDLLIGDTVRLQFLPEGGAKTTRKKPVRTDYTGFVWVLYQK